MGAQNYDLEDAKDRARTELAVELRRFMRRMKGVADAHIQLVAAREEIVNPEEVGREAARQALAEYGVREPQAALPAKVRA